MYDKENSKLSCGNIFVEGDKQELKDGSKGVGVALFGKDKLLMINQADNTTTLRFYNFKINKKNIHAAQSLRRMSSYDISQNLSKKTIEIDKNIKRFEIKMKKEITIEKGFEVWEIQPDKLILLKNPSIGFYFIDLDKKNIITLED
jgi:hypothetical protein